MNELKALIAKVDMSQAALARPAKSMAQIQALFSDALPVDPSAYAAEVALAYDWKADRGREINRGTDSREYGASPTYELMRRP